MEERLKNRIREVLPSVLALLRWLVLAGLTGLACGLAGAAFSWCVARVTALRGDFPWLLFFLPAGGRAIVLC